MQFRVVNDEPQRGQALPNTMYLITDRWNDFGFVTQFFVVYYGSDRSPQNVGHTKIAQQGMGGQWLRTELPPAFEQLDPSFFSLGQDDNYYETLNIVVGSAAAAAVHRALGDIAFNPDIRRAVIGLDVTGTSLLRQVKLETVRGQFQRIAHGGERLTPYVFSYGSPTLIDGDGQPVRLTFGVTPEELPPSNVHALIGTNGSGKTRILRDLARLSTSAASEIGGELVNERPQDSSLFLGTVMVSFSAFDPFSAALADSGEGDVPLAGQVHRLGDVTDSNGSTSPQPPGFLIAEPAAYVGLYDQLTGQVKNFGDLNNDFVESLIHCNQPERARRWLSTMEAFAADEQLAAAASLLTADAGQPDQVVRSRGRALFTDLSSGHKIVLLTITRLVEEVAERCLVLIDEPEAHLHPPLLSAFIRAISTLLTNRNGVAVIATHSPVVLQEIPRECTWIIRRGGLWARPLRPTSETFGESVGVLTEDVFGLELTESGYHTLLRAAANDGLGYDGILARFGGRLGGEARGSARILATHRRRDAGT